MNIDQIYQESLALSDEAQEILVERLVQRLGESISPKLEQQHLDIVKARRSELHKGVIERVDADQVLADLRDHLTK